MSDSSETPDTGLKLIWGAAAIARFLFSDDSAPTVRRVFALAQHKQIPVEKLGGRLCASPEALRAVFMAGLGQAAPWTAPVTPLPVRTPSPARTAAARANVAKAHAARAASAHAARMAKAAKTARPFGKPAPVSRAQRGES